MKTLTILFLCSLSWYPVHGQGTLRWNDPVPSDSFITMEGNSSLFQPFVNPSSRLQQVYSATDFIRIVENGGIGYLDRIFFRTDASGFGSSGIASNLEIRVSTTSLGPDSLSPVFAENVGANETVVFGPMDASVSATHIPRGGDFAQDFSVRIDFTNPFFYRLEDGNLLLDIRVHGGVPIILDAWNRVGDSVGSVYGQVNDLTGTASTIGLATRLGGTLVPEPGPIILALAAGCVALLFHRRKAK